MIGPAPGDRSETTGWGRGKLIAVLAAGVAVAVLLAAGVVVAVWSAVTGQRAVEPPAAAAGPHAQPTATGPAGDARDALAAAPLTTAAPEQAFPAALSPRDPGVIVLPRPTTVGPAGVPTGFPATTAGALAQLAAIDGTAMQSGSMPGVRAVIEQWAQPGGPTGESWTGVTGMISLLTGLGLSSAGSPQLAIIVRPAMGLIKGTVGDEFAVVCVDYEFTVTLHQTARAAIADCQRMVWDGTTWRIGPGAEPAPAPSVWPGTDAAIDAGYQELRYA